jgi:hypothetical protein
LYMLMREVDKNSAFLMLVIVLDEAGYKMH